MHPQYVTSTASNSPKPHGPKAAGNEHGKFCKYCHTASLAATSSLSASPLAGLQVLTMQYPAALRNMQPLHNRGGSTSVETLTGPAPPRYTSQRNEETSAPGAASKHTNVQYEYENEDDDQGSSPSLSMHSFPEDDSDEEALPSPHSVENLGGSNDNQTEEGAESTTGHSYAPCTTDSSFTTSTPPPPSDTQESQHSTVTSINGTLSTPQIPGPYSHETQTTRYAKHYSVPTNPSASVPALARSSGASSPAAMYRHMHSSQPTGIGQVPYRQNKNNTEVYHDANDDILSDDEHNASRNQPLSMSSTATFLPEDANSQPPQFRSHANLSTSSHRQQSSTATQKSTTSTVIASQTSPGRATNYVFLSRKSTIKKAGFFRHATVPSSITGKFTIDPSLHISSALLKALETPSTLVSDVFPRPKGTSPKMRTQNLHLEVENGGIDIDIHLIPPPREYMIRRMTISSAPAPESRPLTRASTVTAVTAPPSKPPFMSEESYARSGWANLIKRPSPLGRHSLDANPYKPPSPPPPAPAPTPVKKYVPAGPLPTLLDLRLKEVKNGKRKDAHPKKGKEFALVARIHAPNPRPPFHLLASTVDIIPYTPSALGNSGIPPPDPNSKSKKPFTRPPRQPAQVPYSRSQSRSPLTLHLPRTFRGPLTINISAGNIDEHVRLSQGLAEASVVLAESAYSRGYFVGKLAPDEEKRGLKKMGSMAEWSFLNGEGDLGRRNGGTSENGDQSRGGDDGEVKPEDGENQDEEEWIGDKVDLFVGSGKVFLQLLGEEDPFGKKGFWSRVMGF